LGINRCVNVFLGTSSGCLGGCLPPAPVRLGLLSEKLGLRCVLLTLRLRNSLRQRKQWQGREIQIRTDVLQPKSRPTHNESSVSPNATNNSEDRKIFPSVIHQKPIVANGWPEVGTTNGPGKPDRQTVNALKCQNVEIRSAITNSHKNKTDEHEGLQQSVAWLTEYLRFDGKASRSEQTNQIKNMTEQKHDRPTEKKPDRQPENQ
jgi:hypothetical protein